jgi:hypothetical protein
MLSQTVRQNAFHPTHTVEFAMPVPDPHIRYILRKFEQFPPGDRATFDAIVTMLQAFTEVPREHHKHVLEIMQTFTELPTDQQARLLRLAAQDVRDPTTAWERAPRKLARVR